jgi:ribose transport system substrate-binding protein
MKILATAVLTATVLSLGACSSSEDDAGTTEYTTLPPLPQKESYRVGFVQVYEENNNWRSTNTASILDEGEARGNEMIFDPGAGFGASDEAQRMQDVIDAKVDAIIVAPQDPTVLAPKVVAARRAGIPVFIEDRSIDTDIAVPGTDYVAYLGSDFETEGKLVGDWLVDHGPQGDIKIIELEGTVGSSPAVARKDGFDAVIAKHSNMEIVASESGDFSEDQAYDLIKPLLEDNPDANVIFTHNDAMAFGVITALKELGKSPGDILIVSIDGLKEGIQNIKDGWIGAIAECNPRFGPLAFDTLESYAAGETIPLKVYNTDRLFDMTSDANIAALEDYFENEAF